MPGCLVRGIPGVLGVCDDTQVNLVQAVVTDLDGTIVRADGTISAATRAAAAELKAAGITLIAATARTPAGLLTALEGVEQEVPIAVCCTGSLGLVPSSGELLWRHTLSPAAICAIIDVLAEKLPDAGIGVYDGQQWTLTPDYFAARGSAPRGRHRFAAASQLAGDAVCELSVCHPRLASTEIARVLAGAGIGPELASLSFGAIDVLDVAPPGIDKATGVKRALELVGVEPQQAIAFGDAPNDLPMFGLVGHAVAVANAHPEVLAAADSVTADVESDGFSSALAGIGVTSAIRPSLPLE